MLLFIYDQMTFVSANVNDHSCYLEINNNSAISKKETHVKKHLFYWLNSSREIVQIKKRHINSFKFD